MEFHNIKRSCALLTLSLALPVMAQNIQYRGTVLDENNQPLVGATVRVAGTASGAITNVDGEFSITVPKNGKVEITYIGFQPKTITDFKQTSITLKEDLQNLDEVVVVGYGTQKKAHLTGAIATVPMDDVKDLSSSGLANSLSGLVNGVSVSGGNSRPGENARISIRGNSALSAVGSTAQEPLFVIDGFVYPNDVKIGNVTENAGATAFNNLDPAEIESISVLKDAAAAVYGARAANGVILVTTKRGKIGEPQISYSGSYGYADEVGRPKMLDSYQYGKLYNAIKAADPLKTSLNATRDLFQADELNAMRGLNYDLLDKYWSTGWTQKHNVGVSGATEKANYFASISYFDQDGNLGKLKYDRWNYRAGVDVTLKKWVKASLQVSGDYGSKETPNVKVGGTNPEKDYNLLLTRPRYIPEYVNGMPVAVYGPSNTQVNSDQNYSFDVLQNSGDFNRSNSNNININTSLEYDLGWFAPLKGLKLRFSYAKSINNDKNNQYGSSYKIYYMSDRAGSGSHLYTPIAGQEEAYQTLLADSNFLYGNGGAPVQNGGTNGGYLSRDMDRSDNYQMNFSLAYNRTFGSHTLGGLFTVERSEFESEYLSGRVTDPYEFTTHQSNSVGQKSEMSTVWTRAEAGTLSYVGRANYAYLDKYLLEALVRIDSSTKFAPENYWGTFPSVSAGWVVSQEDWFNRNVTWIDFMKVRASYGLTGRDNTVAWQWMQTYALDKDKGPVFGTGLKDQAGSHISLNKNNSAVNRNAHWDKSTKGNFGIDLNVLKSRLSFSFDGYYNRDRDMLLPYSASVPGTVGTQSAKVNYGEMDSWGVELSTTWRDRIGKDFSYKLTLNTGYSDNKVLVMDWENDNVYRQITPGHRTDMGTWGMQCIGMFRSFQDIEEYFAKNNIISYMGMNKSEVRPGMLIYKDVRGARQTDGSYAGPDGIVDRDNDQVCLSNRSNPYGMTLNMNATWKGFSVTAQVSGSWGGYSFIPSAALKPGNSIEYTNMPSFWNPDDMFVYNDIYDGSGNLVVAQNREASLPNLNYSSVNSVNSTFWRVSGTRVRLNRLTVAYSLPSSVTKKLGVQACRFNLTGQQLLSLYNPYPDNFIDPMTDFGSYPTLRKFTLGLNLTF